MNNLIRTLTILAGLSLAGCAGGEALDLFKSSSPLAKVANTPEVSAFCQNYERVIRSADDSAAIKSLRKSAALVAKRAQANDNKYRCQCEHWGNQICKSGAP